ncbi:hypothetical protein [Metabacillus sp. 84]|uniref:hypothetical protein n=1 Tax=Metabacillus sp. 84 TaxID=3404705 RepID=UPI003CF0A0CB
MEVKQISIFDVFEIMEQDNDIEAVLNTVWETIDGQVIDNSKLVAICFPDLVKNPLSEKKPSLCTLEDGTYKCYQHVHGWLYEEAMWTGWHPGHYWTWIDKGRDV